jgi:hypothetical protein
LSSDIVGPEPACVTTNDCPAIVIVPCRKLVAEFAAALYDTDPEPVPLAPELIVTKEAVVEAVHAQSLPLAVTVTVAFPPPAPGLADVGDRVKEQVAAACVTVKEWPAIMSVPERDEVVELSATE